MAWYFRNIIGHNTHYLKSYIEDPREGSFINSKSIVLWVGQCEMAYTMIGRFIFGYESWGTESEDPEVIKEMKEFLERHPKEDFKELRRKAMALVWDEDEDS